MSPISDDLRTLYQEVILDHYKRPRNFGPLPAADHTAEGYNPLCGDQVKVSVRLEGGRVADARFEGSGCAISTASASLMTEAVKGRTLEEAEALFQRFHGLVSGKDAGPPRDREHAKGSEVAMSRAAGQHPRDRDAAPASGSAPEVEDDDLGKLEVLAGVRDYPVRIKCATLAWHALRSALHGGDKVTTE
jgi:nitrogen fixation NifU-like protein